MDSSLFEAMAFFQGFTWEALVGLFFTALFGLFPALNLFTWLKLKLNIQDSAANYMVQGVSIILTLVALFVTGNLAHLPGLELNLMNILAFAGMLYKTSQIAYQKFKRTQPRYPDGRNPVIAGKLGGFPD